MEHEEILHRCFRCGFCKLPADYGSLNCPAYLKYRFESFSPGGRMWLIRAWLDGQVRTDARLQEIFFSCATCGSCVEHCIFDKFRESILEAFIAAKAQMVHQGTVPPPVRDYLTRLLAHGNPYKISRQKRGQWAAELGIPPYAAEAEYLFFVGDVGSFDTRGMEIARSVARLLQALGVSFGILGAEEGPDGNDARALGELELFEHLAKRNIEAFRRAGATRIVTLSPHGYNAIKNHYPQWGGDFSVRHYTHLLAEILPASGLRGKAAAKGPRAATFHDPCYLGRHNKDYDTARAVLDLLPGIQRVEMPRHRADSLCCGGGGGNFFTDLVCSGPDAPAAARVAEAAATGAQVLVTACPICTVMLEDAVKSGNLEGRLQVRELSELVLEALAQ